MHVVSAFVPCDPHALWLAFIDVTRLPAWVPGLRRAQTIAMSQGLPGEVHFELGTHAYTLVYSYDTAERVVRWEPKLGAREGVSGFARFDVAPGGTQLTYGLEQGAARNEDERRFGDTQAMVDAFVAWVTRR